MITPPYDLDTLAGKLEQFRRDCMALADECVKAALDLGIPREELYRFSPDEDRSVTWNEVPDVYDTHLEFCGEVWRHQETDIVSFWLDRRVMSGEISISEWASAVKHDYAAKLRQKAVEREESVQAEIEALRALRRATYEELKKEFDV